MPCEVFSMTNALQSNYIFAHVINSDIIVSTCFSMDKSQTVIESQIDKIGIFKIICLDITES